MQRVLRWDVPVDDDWHPIGTGRAVHVAARGHRKRPGDLVEVWTLEDGPDTGPWEVPTRLVTVVGTGHAVPAGSYYIGTAPVPAFAVNETGQSRHPLEIESVAGLVWHVFGAEPWSAVRGELDAGGSPS